MLYNKNSGTHDHGIKRVSHDLLLLHRNQIAREQIGKAVAQKKWRYRALTDLPGLWEALDDGAKAILIDASFLPELHPQLPWLNAGKRDRPALFFVSDRCDIEIHLKAIRAGASQLFSEPLDLNALVTALEEYISPKAKPYRKVLIVEDDESQARLAADLLRKGPFETHTVTQPLDIIDAIWRLQPDLIFMMDFDIRGIDGIVLTRLIRGRKESAAIPIIFLSGEDAPEKKVQALQAGADDFLTLPIQLQQLLTTVKNRIERAKAISSAGVCTAEPKSDSLPARRALLARLEQVELDSGAAGHAHGLIVVVLDDSAAGLSPGGNGDGDQFIGMLVEWFGPLLQRGDYLARIGYCRLALLIRRSNRLDVERLADLAYEVVNYRLAASSVSGRRLGIGLVSLDGATESADELLQQGESAATSASRHEVKGYLLHGSASPRPGEYLVAEPATREQRFRDALRNGSVTLAERRFVGLGEMRHATKVIELIPRSGEYGASDNLYQQAAQYGVAAEFDRFVCDLGFQRLAEYTLTGKPVRLILRQSAAVLEEKTYLEFIKSELRKLHIVGTGLMLEFDLPSLATRLNQARLLFRELNALGIAISLSNFAWSRSAYKAIAYLKADAVRPRPSLLHAGTDSIEQISSQIHALPTEIILPHVESYEQIAPPWSGSADYIQADFTR